MASTREILEDFKRKEKQLRKRTQHKPHKLKGLPWPYCIKCGLLYLRNTATAKEIRIGCDSDIDD